MQTMIIKCALWTLRARPEAFYGPVASDSDVGTEAPHGRIVREADT